MTTADSILQDLEALDGVITRARRDIADGGVVDLAPLETRVNQLCAGIDSLQRDQAKGLQPRLLALLDDLDQLTGQIEAGLAALSAELGDHGKRREAVSAYAKGPKPR